MAVILQIVALVGFPVGLGLGGHLGGALAGASVSVCYVGLALEKRES